jgi:di/tricarboxylate transporter
VTADVLLDDIVERSTRRYLVTKVLNLWEVSMGGSHTGMFIVAVFIILYFSILLHCIVQWVLQVMFLSAFSFIVLVFTVSLHVCLTDKQQRQSKQTNTHAREQQK